MKKQKMTNGCEIRKKEKKRSWELLKKLSRGFKVKRKKTTETEWTFIGRDE